MKSSKVIQKNQNQDTDLNQDQEKEVEVLYQKMGDRWYAFSFVNDEVFVGSISLKEIEISAPEDLSLKRL
jgi:hypothetical protein